MKTGVTLFLEVEDNFQREHSATWHGISGNLGSSISSNLSDCSTGKTPQTTDVKQSY